MKKNLCFWIVIIAMIAMVVSILNWIGIITTKWNWSSFSLVLLLSLASNEQFLKKGEPNKIMNARILGILYLLVVANNFLIFIKSVWR
ncbi:hypothetical protein LGL55_07250 [Clostridium tagluense]|uniref:hypothetical protein n=1 Tax=Clostridium tagluense TaxID=360422 RepID=UPI001CF3DADD|nr:hypothetical protein [Clostridium tagluense]MCB2310875.1 hypothetical protein [Clostridium tagluense]MCB2315729.1 hypothetical protein [Clostridium tagluense]MCB2320627.1 hypothetical protein [Clostridium tagluense]MCB2325468.1 hypothetical protein [Clostridium tagluense]MCB2330321.1 hypothetical protein [Clostridium tagluense]